MSEEPQDTVDPKHPRHAPKQVQDTPESSQPKEFPASDAGGDDDRTSDRDVKRP